MNRIVKIGMDVHSTNYTLCAMEPVLDGEDRIFANIQVTPDYKNVLQFIENLKNKLGPDDSYSIECGYEVGCLGYSLYNQLTSAGVKCIIHHSCSDNNADPAGKASQDRQTGRCHDCPVPQLWRIPCGTCSHG